MNCNTLVCAQSVVTDKATGQVSIFNVYESIQSSLFPIQFPISIFIATEKTQEEPNELTVILKIELENQILFEHAVSLNFIQGVKKNNTTINMQGLLVDKPGSLLFSVLFNNQVLKTNYIVIEHKN